MHFHRSKAAFIILCVGIVCSASNIWFTAIRSTIPIPLNSKIVHKDLRFEKHPGIDDVYLLTLGNSQILQVDQHVFNAVNEGETIIKDTWSKQLRHGSKTLWLDWSADMKGMIWVMSASCFIFAILVFLIWKKELKKGER